MTTDERIQQELDNMNQKVKYAETAQDMLYILDRITHAIGNDAELGLQIRRFVKQHLSNKS